MIIKDNNIPGPPFDYDLKVNATNAHPRYKTTRYNPTQSNNSGFKGWHAVTILLIGFVCFGFGVSVGKGSSVEAVSGPSSAPIPAVTATTTVIQTEAVPTVPASCMLAFDQVTAMQSDLEIIIDSSQTQVAINNRAYVAIVSKKVDDISKVTQEQYNLKRATSHSTLELQNQLHNLRQSLAQCKTDLGR